MENFLDKIEHLTNRYLNYRKEKKELKAQKKAEKKTFKSEAKSWFDAIIFGIVVVFFLNQFLFQFYKIPTPSMEKTLMVKDQIYAIKSAYGTQLFPGTKKVFDSKKVVQRDDIITFINPNYDNKGIIFTFLKELIQRITFTLVNIDRDDKGNIKEDIFVKRAVGFPGESIKVEDGNIQIKLGLNTKFIKESDFRKDNNLSLNPNRTFNTKYYDGLRAYAYLKELQELNIPAVHSIYNTYKNSSIEGYKEAMDVFEVNRSRAKIRATLDPLNLENRSEYESLNLIYVDKDMVLPLGDNRDNSQDGRFFGPVTQKTVFSKIKAIFWPLKHATTFK